MRLQFILPTHSCNVKSASNSYNWSEKVSDFRSPLNASTRRTLPCRHRKTILNWRKWSAPRESARVPMDSTSPMENANVNFQLSCKKTMSDSGIICTVGLRGEPSVDGSGLLVRCSRSADCSQGHMCDPNTHVCCKGINREFGRNAISSFQIIPSQKQFGKSVVLFSGCPKDYVETGELCTNSECKGENEMCHRLKDGKLKVCCVLDDTVMNDAENSTKQAQHNVWYQPSF